MHLELGKKRGIVCIKYILKHKQQGQAWINISLSKNRALDNLKAGSDFRFVYSLIKFIYLLIPSLVVRIVSLLHELWPLVFVHE